MLEDMSLVTVLVLSGADMALLAVRGEFEAGDAKDDESNEQVGGTCRCTCRCIGTCRCINVVLSNAKVRPT